MSPTSCFRRSASAARTSPSWWTTSSGCSTPAWGVGSPAVEQASLDGLVAHSWSGNVRELEHVVESALIAAAGDAISPDQRLTRYDKKEAARRLGLSLASLYRKLEGNTT